MKIKHLEVELRQNETQTNTLLLPTWEVPVLEAVWPGRVTVKGEKLVVRKLPDAASEFTRLLDRYKQARDESGAKVAPYVTMVYGDFATGIRNLQNAISEATGSVVGQPAEREFTQPAQQNAQAAAPEKAKRVRRTKAQIEADKAAKAADLV